MIERLTVVVRVLGAIFFGFLGLYAGLALAEGDTGLVRVLLAVVTPVGSIVFGTLAAPFIIAIPLQRLQEWSKTIPPLQLILGTFGLLTGFLLGALATPFLLTLPSVGGWVAPFVVSFVLGLIGVVVMVGREQEFADFLSRYLPSMAGARDGPTREIVVDTSAIIDGRIVFENRPEYQRVRGWMERHGTVSMFLLSLFPNPLFDVAGVAAGAVKMPLRRFFLAVLAGKVIKDTYLAAVGGLGAEIIVHLLR